MAVGDDVLVELGELLYAREYRNEPVASAYATLRCRAASSDSDGFDKSLLLLASWPLPKLMDQGTSPSGSLVH